MNKLMQMRVMHSAVLLILAVTGVNTSCKKLEEKQEEKWVEVAKPIQTDTAVWSSYVANIEASQKVELRSMLKGYLEKILVDEGQSVRKGQVLFQLNELPFENALKKAVASTKVALAELASVKIEAEATKLLYEKGVVGKPELDLALSRVSTLEARVEEAKANQEEARIALNFTRITAPFDGIVNRLPLKRGALVEEGTILTSVTNIQDVFAYFNLSELEFLLMKRSGKFEGAGVELRLADGRTYQYSGSIETSESEIERGTGNIAIRARFKNPEGLLLHGSSGKVVLKNTLRNALLVPQKSTFEVQEHVYVYEVGDDQMLQQRKIKIKERLPNYYVISEGISAEALIVKEGVQFLRAGEKVQVRKNDSSPSKTPLR